MLEALRKCPTMFAVTSDGSSTMAKMDNSARQLALFVATTNGEFYQSNFGEEALETIKYQLGKDAGWGLFFDVLRNAFNGNCVSILARSEDTAHILCGKEDCSEKSALCFPIQKTEEDTSATILKCLVDANAVYANPKEEKNKVQKIMEELEKAKLQVRMLEEEVRVLCENNIWRRKQDTKNTLKIGKLRDNISRLSNQINPKAKEVSETSVGETSGPHAEDSYIPERKLLRLVFEKKECKEYDVELLRLIKSRWPKTEGSKACNASNCLIDPYTESELPERLSRMSKKHKMVWGTLNGLDDWDYNVFELQAAIDGDDINCKNDQSGCGALFITMYALVVKYGFLRKFEINERIFLNWLSAVEGGYHANPYHNSMHAADVLHITHYLLSKGGLAELCKLNDRQVLAALFAAAIHDYNHPGINNNFSILTQTYNATLYNDRSVLENMHVASVFELMRNPALNILACFSEEHWRDFRNTVIDMVLATDMSLHEKYMTQFKRRLSEKRPFTEDCDQNLALAMALKLADISNCCRPLPLYLKWSERVSDEFYTQGDRERSLGMSCSPFMDRQTPMIAEGQTSFINYIFIPFLEVMAEFLPSMGFTLGLAAVCKSHRLVGNTGQGT